MQALNQHRNFEFNNNLGGGGSGGGGYDNFENRLREDNNQLINDPIFDADQYAEDRGGQSVNASPSKTGGQLRINNLNPTHVTAEQFRGRDALNVIEGEMRQFETKFDVFKRFVE